MANSETVAAFLEGMEKYPGRLYSTGRNLVWDGVVIAYRDKRGRVRVVPPKGKLPRGEQAVRRLLGSMLLVYKVTEGKEGRVTSCR